MKLAFDAPKLTAIPVLNSDLQPGSESNLKFPVRRVYCVGRNYAEHAKEMGHDSREKPFFFTKPADAIVVNPVTIAYPPMTSELHHEVELVVAIGKNGFQVELENAWDHVFGYALGIDFTKRDLQSEFKKKSRPWDLAKGFDQSAPISSIIPFKQLGKMSQAELELLIDNEIRQKSSIQKMIWSIPEIIVELSQHIELKAGDLIFTGTPSGVGGIKKKQKVTAKLSAHSISLKLDFKLI